MPNDRRYSLTNPNVVHETSWPERKAMYGSIARAAVARCRVVTRNHAGSLIINHWRH